MGLESPAGRGERNCKPKATALSRGIVGRNLSANVGPDEQESDTRPSSLATACFNDGSLGLSSRSICRFKEKIRYLTRRNKPGRFEEKIDRLNMLLRGWVNYYRYIRSDWLLKEMDGLIRRKLRVVKLKQLKRRYTICKFNIRNGVERYQAWIGVLGGKGLWRKSAIPQSHQSMSLKWFRELGLVSMSERWKGLRDRP